MSDIIPGCRERTNFKSHSCFPKTRLSNLELSHHMSCFIKMLLVFLSVKKKYLEMETKTNCNVDSHSNMSNALVIGEQW